MAIALVQTAALGSNSGGTSQQTSAFGSNPTVGNYLVAWAWGWQSTGAAVTTTFSDSAGNTWTVPTGAKQSLANDLWCVVGYARVATTAASFKVTLSTGSISSSIMVVAAEFSGIAAASPLDGAAVGTTGTTGSPAPGSLAFTAGDLLVAVMSRDDSSFLGSTPTGFTRAGFQNNGTTFQVGEGIYQIAPASPTNPTWASSTNKWAAAQFALLTAAGGAAAVYVPRPFPFLPGGILAQ